MSESDPNGSGGRRGEDSSATAWRQGIMIGGLALSLPGMLFGPPALGYWLDSLLGTKPWLFLIFLVVALLGSCIDVYLILKRMKVLE